jgi:hypothetical protein
MTAPEQPDVPEVCHRTDSEGTITVDLPTDPAMEWMYVNVTTNDFVPCFGSHKFSTANLTTTGRIEANTCGPAGNNLALRPGTIILYGHQMSFREVLKSMGQEL